MPEYTESMLLCLEDHALASTVTGAAWTTPQNVAYPRHDSGTIPTDFDSASGARVLVFDLGRARRFDAVAVVGLKLTAGTVVPTDVTWKVRTADDSGITTNVTDWGTIDYVYRKTGVAVPRLGMEQPNLGPEDWQLPAVMNANRLHGLHLRDAGSELDRQFVEVSFINGNSTDAADALYVPKIFIGWMRLTVNWRSVQLSAVPLRPGKTLRRWQVEFQAYAEDEAQRVLLANLVPGKRAFFALDPADRPEYFLGSGTGADGSAAMVEITQVSVANTGNTAELSGAPDLGGFHYDVSLTLIERFAGETEG